MVEIVELESGALAANPLGDPATRQVPVYLPPGFRPGMPVIYCLAGYLGGGRSWLGWVPFGESLPERMDRLVAAGAPPAALVMPDCFSRLGGSQYVNSPAIGRYEDHIVAEIVPHVDRTFGPFSARGLLGKSSGGYGALLLAMRHPELFSAAACHAGDMGFEWSYKPALPNLALALHAAGGAEPWLRQVLGKAKRSGAEIGNLSTLCACAAYSPDPTQPLGIGVPLDGATGQLDEAMWARFAAHDPIALVRAPNHAAALRALRLLYLDAGLRDEHHLQLGARAFTRVLGELAIPCEYQEFDDGHRDTAYRYDVSIPKLARALG
jgi:enterochelin esterase family protein